MRSMMAKAHFEVASVEITFETRDSGSSGRIRLGPQVTARVHMYHDQDGKPLVAARPQNMAINFSGSHEIAEKIRELIEAQGLDVVLGTHTTDGWSEAKDARWHAERSGSDPNRAYPVGSED